MPADAELIGSRHRSRAPRATGAFTLIELVLVVAILATLAGLVAMSIGDAEAQSTASIASHELNQVRQAVLRFREDTGFLPRQGLFDLEARGGRVRTADFPGPETHTDHLQWFDAPENLWQLYECPLAVGDPMARPAPGRRGWRGPYLTRSAEARFRAPASTVPPVPAVADPFVHATNAEWYSWSSATEQVDALARHRPILLLNLEDPELARVVSSGPDGLYDLPSDPTPDDLVLYLLR